jgi:hypothetical protein
MNTLKCKAMEVITKLILTNKSAILKKYKSKAEEIFSLLDKIKFADKKRGITTAIYFLDDKDHMKEFGGALVKAAGNQKQNKDAIDAIYNLKQPNYILLFGSEDIIPFIHVLNPIYGNIDDNLNGIIDDEDTEDGEFIKSDLPYACNIPFTTDYKKYFKNGTEVPARAIGRIPDIFGAADLNYVKKVVTACLQWKPQKSFEAKAMVLAAYSWRSLTQSLAASIFKTRFHLLLSPSKDAHLIPELLRNYKIHLINCHGGSGLSNFNGEKGGNQNVALSTRDIDGNIKPGTIAVAESCYGAELFRDHKQGYPICQNYLEEGAYAFLGSTTSSYGTTTDTIATDADIICRNFLQNVLKGRSTGSALLQARSDFKKTGFVSGIDRFINYKTLLQFYLLGDPSIHLVKKAGTSAVPAGVIERRKSAVKKAAAIQNAKLSFTRFKKVTHLMKEKIQNEIDQYNMVTVPIRSFKIQEKFSTNGHSIRAVKKKGSRVQNAVSRNSIKSAVTQGFNQHVVVNKTVTIQVNNKKAQAYKILFINEKNGKIINVKCVETKTISNGNQRHATEKEVRHAHQNAQE